MGKDFKDYSIVKYFVKQLKGSSLRNFSRDSISAGYLYGQSVIPFCVYFEKRRSVKVIFLLNDVYEKYGKNRYESLQKFCEAFVTQNQMYDLEVNEDTGFTIVSNIKEGNRVDHVASQAFANIAFLLYNLNDFLGRKEEGFTESDVRDLHREYLASQSKKMRGLVSTGLIALVYLVVFLIFEFDNIFLALLFLLCLFYGVGGTIFFFLRKKYYDIELKRAERNK